KLNQKAWIQRIKIWLQHDALAKKEFIENVVLNRSKAQRTIYPSSNLYRVLRKLQGDATNAPAPPSLNKKRPPRMRRKKCAHGQH
ncbi:MAG: hypothetical protein ACHQUC_02025, partial [Chlamydiales bacterium]